MTSTSVWPRWPERRAVLADWLNCISGDFLFWHFITHNSCSWFGSACNSTDATWKRIFLVIGGTYERIPGGFSERNPGDSLGSDCPNIGLTRSIVTLVTRSYKSYM